MQCNQITSCLALLVVTVVWWMPQQTSAGDYKYGYGVNSPANSDIKDQQEQKVGDQVTGYYRSLDSDGLVRTVDYQSNPQTGFQAQVTRGDSVEHHGLGSYQTGYQGAGYESIY